MAYNPSFFNEPDSCRTIALQVENHHFWISGEILSVYSPVFKAMFYGQFAESNEIVIPLPGKRALDIQEFLLCLIPTPQVKPIDDSNADLMLAMADEYQIDDLRGRVETFLCTKWEKRAYGGREILDILQVACKHRLKRFLEPAIRICAWEFEMDQLEAACVNLPKAIISSLYLYKKAKPNGQWEKFDQEYDDDGHCDNRNCPNDSYYSRFYWCTYCSLHQCNQCKKSHVCMKQWEEDQDCKRMQDAVKILLNTI